MIVDPISGKPNFMSDLREIGSNADAGLKSNEGFGKIFSSAIDSIKSETAWTENVKPSDMAEILRLEMLRNSLLISETNTDPRMTGAGRKLSLLLENLEQFSKGASAPYSVQDEVVARDVNGDSQCIADLDVIIKRASKRYQVDAGLIKAVIKAESNFKPTAVSPAGAKGLMQLMPATAQGLGVKNSFDPEQNVMGGTRFLKQMLDRYDGNIDLALSAYNWGPGNLEKKGATLPRETREYLIKVKGYYAQYSV